MSTLNTINLKNPSSASNNVVLGFTGGVSIASTVSVGTTIYTPSINDGPIAGSRNRIINGDMRIDQRNAGVSTSTSQISTLYTLDRWYIQISGSSPTVSVQRSGVVPVGFTSSLLVNVTTGAAVTTGDSRLLEHRIEGFNISDLNWGTASASPVTLSFWVRSSLTGTFSGALSNSDANRAYPFNFTINSANTWEYETVTIPGDTTGTWLTDNSTGIRCTFNLGSGSNFLGTSGSWGTSGSRGATGSTSLSATTGATLYLTGVQLEAGTVATPFERRSYGQELALCQRYFETNYPPGYAAGFNFNEVYPWTNSKAWGLNFNASDDAVTAQSMYWKVTKRNSPVVTIYSPNNGTSGQGYRYSGSAGTGNFTMSVTYTTPDHALITVTLAATSSTSEAYFMFTANSEL